MNGSERNIHRARPGPSAIKEALLILLSALLLGFAYSAIAQKGIFGRLSGAVSAPSDAAHAPEKISLEQAKAYLSSGNALFIDTRTEKAYREGHIEGAINVPLADMEAEIDFLKEVSAEKLLIPYCDGGSCHSSIEFSERLLASGISKIKVFYGGWEEWKAARLPTARSGS